MSKEVPDWLRKEGVERLPDYISDLRVDLEEVRKLREYRTLPRLCIPKVGEPSIAVETISEPYTAEKLPEYFINVIELKSRERMRMECPRELILEMYVNGIYSVSGGNIVLGGQRLSISTRHMSKGGNCIVAERIQERDEEEGRISDSSINRGWLTGKRR